MIRNDKSALTGHPDQERISALRKIIDSSLSSARAKTAARAEHSKMDRPVDMAPATSPATPVTRMLPWLGPAAATPIARLAVETMPSLAPSTAARSQPMRSVR